MCVLITFMPFHQTSTYIIAILIIFSTNTSVCMTMLSAHTIPRIFPYLLLHRAHAILRLSLKLRWNFLFGYRVRPL